MGRILAIDYGGRRCGLAVTDPLRLSVNPRPVVSPEAVLAVVEEVAAEGDLDRVVLTRSSRADGTPNPIQARIDRFAARLAERLPGLPIDYQDEYGSSKEARSLLRTAGVGKRRRAAKGALDSVSAAVILERYLRDQGIW